MSDDRPGTIDETPTESRLRARLERERQARHEAEQIAERMTRELYERQEELALLVDVARAANECADAEEALTVAIAQVCRFTGWPVGHVWLGDGSGRLVPSGIWHLEHPDRFETFRRITEVTTLEPGVGLAGRVLSGAESVWISDVSVDGNFPRGRAGDLGVRGGFGSPILVGAEVVGVMEFFSLHVEAPDPRLLQLMGQIGTQLGRAIERDRARAGERQLLAELSARATELERSNGDLEQFASIASHDLQEPLRKVRTFTQRVTETEADNLSERGVDYLRRANNAAARMQTLVEDLLMFSRVSTRGRPFEPVDLAQLTRDVLEDLETVAERAGVVVEVGRLPTVDADALQMRQLMQNLLSNAIKFRHPQRPLQVTVEGRLAGEAAQIVVTDNGIGFEPQYRSRIFRVFERLHGRSAYDGTGIGLALCRKIVERHGGAISADGRPDEGATFTVELPLRHPGGDPWAAHATHGDSSAG
jgi:signal transduction histidine kinase